MAGYFTKKRTIPTKISWKSGYVSGSSQINLDSFLDLTPQVTQQTTSFSSLDRSDVQSQKEFLLNSLEVANAQSLQLAGDTGHTFNTIKREVIFPRDFKSYSTNVVGGRCYVRAPLWVYESSQLKSWPSLPADSVNYYGTLAIKKTIPTNPVAGLATFTGELHMRPQMYGSAFLKEKSNLFNALGKEYLNLAFGWTPFVSDLIKAGNSLANASVAIRQLLKDSGKDVRRRYDFPPFKTNGDVTNVTGSTASMVPSMTSSNYDPLFVGGGVDRPSKIERQEILTQKIWFSGKYSYYLPATHFKNGQFTSDSESVWDRLVTYEALWNKVLGTRLTPTVLYNLTPWTWLADWYANIGDVISNVVSLQQDNLVIKYGYLMCETTLEVIYTASGFKFTSFNPGPLVTAYRQTRKSRYRATPYGFGLNPASFTPQQWAILGALALTKTPSSLKAV
jgi:hypothetical protein